MTWWTRRSASLEAAEQIAAIGNSHAMVEFNLDGTIIKANQIFLATMGYSLAEMIGKHHCMFVEPSMRESSAYFDFWGALNRGIRQSGEFKRLGKNGREVWIQGAYDPILNRKGLPSKILKICSDITKSKVSSLEDRGWIAAIYRSQAVIEFNLDGTIISANESFLGALGYSLPEIQNKHHSMFVSPSERASADYGAFWASLNRGEYHAAEYKRIGKGGREVWILATYNPILDESGRPFKIVKFASDVTEQKLRTANYSGQIESIGKSQAVIEFSMDGIVLEANHNFLSVLGYSLPEIQGRHHRMFVPVDERDGAQYREFWASLRRGEYQAAEYKRLGKGGKEVWIQCSYNPILNLKGEPYKVVKYATDTTAQVVARMKSERVRSMLESVAAGTEELNASVREISEAMAKSRNTATSAVNIVEEADAQAQRLSVAAQAMGGIVELISSITGQINLLALNATIESARAGDAGRGFAVVAAEVKNLANQAKQATDKISGEIAGLNSISIEVVDALVSVKREIQKVSEYVTATAAAVEEQSAVTRDMSSSMQRAAAEASGIGR